MCVDGAGHDQTCKADKGCIFSPKYARIGPFQQQCRAAFGVTPEQTLAAVEFTLRITATTTLVLDSLVAAVFPHLF